MHEVRQKIFKRHCSGTGGGPSVDPPGGKGKITFYFKIIEVVRGKASLCILKLFKWSRDKLIFLF